MEKINELRRILHTNSEKYPKIETGTYKLYNKIRYTVTDKDIHYIKYFIKHFNELNETDKQKVLDKPKSDVYKIYKISKGEKSYVGSTSTSLFYFYRFNLFLLFTKQQSVFDLIKTKDPKGTDIKLLEIVKPPDNTRTLVKDRKEYYSDGSVSKPINRDTSVVDAYMSIYNGLLCRPVEEKKIRYVYMATQKDKSYLFFSNKKINSNKGDKIKEDKIKDQIRDKHRFTKDDIKLELIEKIAIRNSLEENIMKDRYRILYNPSYNKKFSIPELEEIKNLNNKEDIEYLRKCVFLRTNKIVMLNRYKRYLDEKNFVYMLRNKVNGRGAIKHQKTDMRELIESIYDKSLKGSGNALSKDLSIFPEKEFIIKILRRLKEDDDPKTIISRFEHKFNLSGYSLNLRQIYSIINSKK